MNYSPSLGRVLLRSALAWTTFARRALLAILLWSCGSVDETHLSGSEASEGQELGALELALSVSEEIALSRLGWRIDGNGFTDSGELVVGRRPVAVARLGGIPVGEGYTVWISSDDPAMRCSGTASFAVRRASTTAVRVNVQCVLTATTGQVTLTAPINVCPVVTALSATPLELEVGETAQLSAEARDLDEGPARLSVRWESDGASFSSASLSAAFTCVKPGQTLFRVTVSDGACEGSAAVVLSCVAFQMPRRDWPGAPEVRELDPSSTFSENISGAAYLPSDTGAPGTLWIVQNGPSRLFQLVASSAGAGADGFVLPEAGPWRAGKYLTYPNGGGEPDAEGLTFAGSASVVYVATERDNARGGTSRLSVLRFELDTDEAALAASHEWNLTAQLPRVGANLGLEGISWVPDELLVAQGFFDESSGAPYEPADYPPHAGGLFFVGVEGDGMIYALVLDHEGGEAFRVASFPSGHAQVMGLEFDPDTGLLWAACDDTCQGEVSVFSIAPSGPSRGRFQLIGAYRRPGGMPNINNEDLAIAPDSECELGLKPIFWVDDGSTRGHSVRGGLIACDPSGNARGGSVTSAAR